MNFFIYSESNIGTLLKKERFCSLRNNFSFAVLFLVFLETSAIGKGNILKNLKFCTRSTVVDFNPFRSDFQPSQYVQYFTTPLMGENAIIIEHYFSPDGLKFTAKINPNLTFSISRRKITPREVALCIAAQLIFRIPERGIRVAGTSEAWITKKWWTNLPEGVTVQDQSSEFTIQFEVDEGIKNIPGVIRELFERQSFGMKSTFWVGSTVGENPGEDFVSPYHFETKGGVYFADVLDNKIEIVPSPCRDGKYDFMDLSPQSIKTLEHDEYNFVESRNEATHLLVLSSKTLSLSVRAKVALEARKASFNLANKNKKYRTTPGHFKSTEAGYNPSFDWDKSLFSVYSANPLEPKNKVIVRILVYSYSAALLDLTNELTDSLKTFGVTLKFYEKDEKNFDANSFDGYLLNFPLASGRQKWIQGAVWGMKMVGLVEDARETFKSLKITKERASSTLPVDSESLGKVNEATSIEASIVPLVRYNSGTYYHKASPLKVEYSKLHNIPRFTR